MGMMATVTALVQKSSNENTGTIALQRLKSAL